ncbi:MAG: 50S ribosomal protein L25 [Phycisphaerales bacterium]|nr:MAG: 50S ribosomal protein L25 [Phycisphaerales bacterium]
MEPKILKAIPRPNRGTRHARRERAEGRIPAIVYGHNEAPEPISLVAHDVEVELAHGARVLTLDVGGEEGQYLIKEIQHDYRSPVPVHLDLMRVALDERVVVTVPIELRGTPKGVLDGGVLDHLLSEVEVECVVTDIPDAFRPLVTELTVEKSLTVADLEVPPGVTINHDPDDKIAMIRVLAEVPEAEPVAAEEEAAQPEVIGRVKEEEEEKSGE